MRKIYFLIKGLTNGYNYAILPKHLRCDEYRGIEQLEARRAHNPEVGGSSPPPATRKEKVIPNGMAFFFSLSQVAGPEPI